MKFKPLDDRVLVEPMDIEEHKGLILIPDSAKEKSSVGRVIAVGTDEALREAIQIGDIIIYGKYAGDDIKFEGCPKSKVITRADIYGTVVEE